MTDKNSQIAFEEFVKFCNEFLAKAKCDKRQLASKLGLEYTYFSKLYNGHRPVSNEILAAIRILAESQMSVQSPIKAKGQNELPLDVALMREQITQIKAILDEERSDNKELRERVAVLESDQKRANADSEKKIRGIVTEAIRVEVGRIAEQYDDPLSGRREAAGG